MNVSKRIALLSLVIPLTVCLATPCDAVELLSAGDFIIAIDTDPPTESNSASPDGESAVNALDSFAGTKYLNFGKLNTGFIATPFTSATIVQSMVLTTANDAEARDPASWEIYGTNDVVSSSNHSFGDQENWSLIASGQVSLPAQRETVGPTLDFGNSTPYNSYRIVFPTIKNAAGADAMQIADVELYTGAGATGTQVFNSGNPVVAIGFDPKPSASSPGDQGPGLLIDDFGGPSSRYPDVEAPPNAIDGSNTTKYLNFGGSNSGFIITPAAFGPSQVQSFRLTTANDNEGRDPAAWQLYGTNDPIVSADNSFGTAESWTLIDSGSVSLPDARETPGTAVSVNNSSTYASYKMLFPELKTPGDPIMQIAEAALYESNNGSQPNILDPNDPILAIDEDVTPGTQTTHLNFGKENSGFIVTPSVGRTTVKEFQITTGGDEPPRDPASWDLYGTNDPISSEAFSQGDQEQWVLIDSGAFDLDNEIPVGRHTTGSVVSIDNADTFSSYRMIFPSLRDTANANSVQMAEVQFFGDLAGLPGDFNNDGNVDGADLLGFQQTDVSGIAAWQSDYGAQTASLANAASVPEPTPLGLTIIALTGGWSRCRRRGRN